ncbi:universal stress protein [Streptomyces sp. NPDC006624]|uniref:universal stress protein n=1 Tax=Streptomyces sp. NPDC006624 TaxID=3154892 RepID=UPI0033B5FB43
MTQHTAENTVVVGVDGSAASMEALRWAACQARALDADLVAVHAWEQAGTGLAPYAPVPARPSADEQRHRAAQVLAETVRAVLGPRTGGAVRGVVVEGPAARVLVQQAQDARLLVLGRTARRQRDLPSVGSVGRACLRLSAVPVVTVPAADPAARSAAASLQAVVPGRRYARAGAAR